MILNVQILKQFQKRYDYANIARKDNAAKWDMFEENL